MIDGKDSYLPILTFDGTDGWDEFLQLAQPELDSGGVQRLLAALGAKAKTVALERHYIDKDYRDTFSNFHSKRFSTPDSRCLRLHFLSRAVTREEIKHAAKIQADYLGYAHFQNYLPAPMQFVAVQSAITVARLANPASNFGS